MGLFDLISGLFPEGGNSSEETQKWAEDTADELHNQAKSTGRRRRILDALTEAYQRGFEAGSQLNRQKPDTPPEKLP